MKLVKLPPRFEYKGYIVINLYEYSACKLQFLNDIIAIEEWGGYGTPYARKNCGRIEYTVSIEGEMLVFSPIRGEIRKFTEMYQTEEEIEIFFDLLDIAPKRIYRRSYCCYLPDEADEYCEFEFEGEEAIKEWLAPKKFDLEYIEIPDK